MTIVVAAGGLTVSALLAWAASLVNGNSNTMLLHLQVRQVASTVATSLTSVQSQLADALAVATNSPSGFSGFAAAKIGRNGFATESLWIRGSSGTTLVADAGSTPQLVTDGLATRFFTHIHPSTRLQVTPILSGSPPRVGYAYLAPGDPHYIVYAEGTLPRHHQLTVSAASPFGNLDYAVYLGSPRPSHLVASSPGSPVGPSATAAVPFGDTTLTIVAVPKTALTGGLSSALPWIVLFGGAALSLVSAVIVEYIARRRRYAEGLSRELNELYSEQQSIASTLQHALLPDQLPQIPGVDIAARYLAGGRGVDVGGDWYDFVPVGEGRFVVIVGDVSGRGVRAASVMAALRFASRGFALEGHPPDVILEHLRKMLDVSHDGHFATVLCGLIDVENRRAFLASAGHLPPVLVGGSRARVLASPPRPPVGVAAPEHEQVETVEVSPGATLIACTDGLIERRGEALDEGMRRLEALATGDHGSVDELLNHIVQEMTDGSPVDDVALIGVRWLP